MKPRYLLALLLFLTAAWNAQAYPPYGNSGPGPSLGVLVRELPFPELGRLGLDHGVRIVQVMPGSPADQAGLQPGDIVQTLNERPVYSASRLRWLVLQTGAGNELSLEYLRGKERVEVRLSPTGAQPPSPAPPTPPGPPAGEAFLGVHLQAMTPQLREAFGVPGDNGVLVAKVVPASPAEQAGLRAGDIIVRLDSASVHETDDVYRVLDRHAPGDTVQIELVRAGEPQRLSSTLAQRAAPSDAEWWRRSENARDMRDFLPPPEYWRRLMDHMMQSLEDSMDELRDNWPEDSPRDVY
jgi:S1-C subfamily serine protease